MLVFAVVLASGCEHELTGPAPAMPASLRAEQVVWEQGAGQEALRIRAAEVIWSTKQEPARFKQVEVQLGPLRLAASAARLGPQARLLTCDEFQFTFEQLALKGKRGRLHLETQTLEADHVRLELAVEPALSAPEYRRAPAGGAARSPNQGQGTAPGR